MQASRICDNVLDDIDDLLMAHIPAPMDRSESETASQHITEHGDTHLEYQKGVQRIESISNEIVQLQRKQIELIEQQQKQMASLTAIGIPTSTAHGHHALNNYAVNNTVNMNVNAMHMDLAIIANAGKTTSSAMTPNTSYNSLASLDTNGTAASSFTMNTESSWTSAAFASPQETISFDDDSKYHEEQQHFAALKQRPQQSYEECNHRENSHDRHSLSASANVFKGCAIKIRQFEVGSHAKVQLKDYVFISKECTRKLAQYVVNENWGKECGLLYKYIDYIFRCQVFKHQVIQINGKYVVFHSNLQRRSDGQFLYVLLVPNKKQMTQKWRVHFQNIAHSFLSKQELLSKFSEPYVLSDYLPQRTRFCTCLADLLYDENYSIEVNWEERLMTNKDRIYKVLGHLAFFDRGTKYLKLGELVPAFDAALQQTQCMAQNNPRLAVAQGFIDSKHCKYRMELLLPMVVEFPSRSSNYYAFALAVSKSTDSHSKKKYIAKSILTLSMAYANARLVGYVDSVWLKYGHPNHAKVDINGFFLHNNSK